MRIRKIIRIVWASAGVAFLIWNWSTFQSRHLPADTFADTDSVMVKESDDMISFISLKGNDSVEVIFLQGGFVDPDAYAPLCRRVAQQGFTTHIIKASFRLPQYDYEKILNLFNDDTKKLVIGGHSQGAKVATQFVFEHPTMAKGLFLLGTSHPRDISLEHITIPCIKVYAENDGLASVQEVLQYEHLLPKGHSLIFIEGGNHSQFGYTGSLFFDDDASITRDAQQEQVFHALAHFLNASL